MARRAPKREGKATHTALTRMLFNGNNYAEGDPLVLTDEEAALIPATSIRAIGAKKEEPTPEGSAQA